MKIEMNWVNKLEDMIMSGLMEESDFVGDGVYMSDDGDVNWVRVSENNIVEVMDSDKCEISEFVDEVYEERYDDVVRYYWWVKG